MRKPLWRRKPATRMPLPRKPSKSSSAENATNVAPRKPPTPAPETADAGSEYGDDQTSPPAAVRGVPHFAPLAATPRRRLRRRKGG